jgi:hypothetical protein
VAALPDMLEEELDGGQMGAPEPGLMDGGGQLGPPEPGLPQEPDNLRLGAEGEKSFILPHFLCWGGGGGVV